MARKSRRGKSGSEHSKVMPLAKQSTSRWLSPSLWLVVIVVALRCWVLLDVRDAPYWISPTVDEKGFLDLANNIRTNTPPTLGAYYIAPGYSYLLAGVQALGGDPFWIKYLQLALGILNSWLIFNLGRHFFDSRTGFLAGIMWALYPAAIMHEVLLLKPTLTVLFSLLALTAVMKQSGASRWRWAAAGLALGLACLLRGELILVTAFLCGGSFLARWRRWPGAPSLWLPLLLVSVVVIILAIPTYYNLKHSGEFVVVAYGGGTNFFIGNNAEADGSYRPLRQGRSDVVFEERDAVLLASQKHIQRLGPASVSQHWYLKGLSWWAQEPLRATMLTGKKALLCWGGWEGYDVLSLPIADRWLLLLRNPVIRPFLILPLALVGIFINRKRREFWPVWSFLLASTIGLSFFFIFDRFRLHLVAVAMIFTAALLSAALDALREKRTIHLLKGSGVALGIVVLLSLPSIQRNEVVLHVNIGNMLLAQERYKEALEEYAIVRHQAPQLGRVLINIANAEFALGRLNYALYSLEGALDFLQFESRSTGNISAEEVLYCLEMSGDIASTLGQHEQAQQFYQNALNIQPNSTTLTTKLKALMTKSVSN